MNTAVGYSRVSTNIQVDGFGLDSQDREIRKYCMDNNIMLDSMFVDKGKSGADTDREELIKAIDYTINNNINYFIVYKLSRLSRSLFDLLGFVEKLKENNVNVVFISEGINTKDIMGNLLLNIMGSISELERDNIKEFTGKGHESRALSGLWNGGRMLGYRSKEDKLIQVSEEVNAVRDIFGTYESLKNLKKTTYLINQRGYKTINELEFSDDAIRNILRNPAYRGIISYNSPFGANIVVEGKHKGIVEEDQWLRVNEYLDFERINTYNPDHLLSGILLCPDCKSPMVYHQNGKYEYYRCSHNKDSGNCKTNLAKKKETEESLLSKLKKMKEIANSKYIDFIVDSKYKELQDNLKKINKDIDNQNSIKEKLVADYTRDIINKEEMKEKMDKIVVEDMRLAFIKDNILEEIKDSSISINDYKLRLDIIKKCDEILRGEGRNKKIAILKFINFIEITKGDNTKSRVVGGISFRFNINCVYDIDVVQQFGLRYTFNKYVKGGYL